MADRAAEYLAQVETGSAERKTGSGRAECLIARLAVEGRLSEPQFMAGARFREAHHNANRGAGITHRWPKGHQGVLLPAWRVPDSEATRTAREAYAALLRALGRLAVPALAMAVHDRPPREYGLEVFQYRNVNSASAAGLVSLIHALDVLADALGLADRMA